MALAERRAVRVDDAAADVRHAHNVSKLTSLVPGPLLAVPLLPVADEIERPLGVLTVLCTRGGAPFTDDDERILGLIAARVAQALVEEDRKEKSRAQAQLQTIGHMLSGIVHDFKTPMTVISGYVQLLAAEEDPREREKSAEVVLKSCEQMTTMIKELLSFAKGDSTVLLRKVWLEPFTAEVSTMLQRLVERSDVTLHVDGQSRAAARLDDLKMKRALVNLVKNAKEAGAASIDVTIKDDGDDVIFVVKDDGPGLAPEIESRVFESFATFGKAEGTGLGLAFVKRIAEEHHGGVVVDSVVGGGCTFTLRVPRA